MHTPVHSTNPGLWSFEEIPMTREPLVTAYGPADPPYCQWHSGWCPRPCPHPQSCSSGRPPSRPSPGRPLRTTHATAWRTSATEEERRTLPRGTWSRSMQLVRVVWCYFLCRDISGAKAMLSHGTGPGLEHGSCMHVLSMLEDDLFYLIWFIGIYLWHTTTKRGPELQSMLSIDTPRMERRETYLCDEQYVL